MIRMAEILNGFDRHFIQPKFSYSRGCIILVLSIADDLRNGQRVISSIDLEDTMLIYGKNQKTTSKEDTQCCIVISHGLHTL